MAIQILKQDMEMGVNKSTLLVQFNDMQTQNVTNMQSVGEDRVLENSAAEQIPSNVILNLDDIPEGEGETEAVKQEITAFITMFIEWYEKIPH